MKHSSKGLTIVLAVLVLTGTLSGQVAFSDGFEDPAFDPFWSTREDYGTLSLSSEQSSAGAQSAKMASVSGGQRDIHLYHDLAAPQKGTVAVDIYDSSAGQETLYHKLTVSDLTTGLNIQLGIEDFDSTCYTAFVYRPDFGLVGPNAPCGVYPQARTTPIVRTIGWHRFEVELASTEVYLRIDGITVFSTALDLVFDQVRLSLSGPYYRPNTTTYFDNFSMAPLSPTYSCMGFYAPLDRSPVKVRRNRVLPLKSDILNESGVELTDVDFVARPVVQVLFSPDGGGAAYDVTSESLPAGLGGEGNQFVYEDGLWRFNLATKNYSAPGTYTVTLTSGDELEYVIANPTCTVAFVLEE